MSAEPESDGPFTRLLVRFATHGDGRLRGGRLLGLAFLGGLVVAIGTTVAIVVADAGNPATLSIWVIVAFLGVKLPLLGLLWWILGRRQRDEVITDDELRAMLDRIRTASETALRTPDREDRLAILLDEARFVAGRATPALRPEAEALLDRLESMTNRAPTSSVSA